MGISEQIEASSLPISAGPDEMWENNEITDCSPLICTVGLRKRCDRCERCGASCRDSPCGWAFLRGVTATAFAVVFLVLGRTQLAAQPVGSTRLSANSRRSFVCITGQLERLELENKIVTVLEPLRRAGYDPDIALVLDDTTSFVTNDQRIEADFIPPFDSYENAAGHLRDLDFNIITDVPYKQIPDPLVNEDYVRLLHKHSTMSDEKHLERAKNNIRMLESWAQCYPEMTKDLERVGSYDLAIRIREDSGFLEALDIEEITKQLAAQPKTIISNGCRFGGGGMNDKFAIVSMDAAQTYFAEPFRYMYTKPIDKSVKSSETFIYYTYLEEGMNVVHSDTIRHIVKLKSDEAGRTILYPQESKKLEKMCKIAVAQDEEPNACTSTWDADQHQLESRNQICWPYSYMINNSL